MSELTTATVSDTRKQPRDDADDGQEAAQRAVLEAIGRLRFGEVTVTIHDGAVVQIESTERTRLPARRR